MSDSATQPARVAWVTGGARGIGRGIALALADAGYDVAINDILDPGETAAAVRQAGRRAIELTADITDEHQVRDMVAQLETEFGRLDLLVNNAGIELHKPIEDFTHDQWRRVIDVNLSGAFLCSVAALPLLKAAGRSCVVCITSVHDRFPKKGTTPYCVAKAGLGMLVNGLALEWAHFGVRVVGLAPGAVETDINRQELTEAREMYLNWIPAGRFCEPREIGDAVAWLASDQAGYISGTTLTVDGAISQAFHRLDMSHEKDETT